MTVEPLITGHPTEQQLSEQLLGTVSRAFGRTWKIAVLGCALLTCVLFFCVSYTFIYGIGVWGNNIPVAWAFGIVNFVWWIGIGHAGTFISAFLLLFEQRWRNSINRFAEAMTLFAVVQAGLFPLLHLGRPWFAYWLFPYPSTMRVWPQVKSALPWDAAAVSTYALVSLMFWYLGLIPDLAALRDAGKTRARRIIYGIFALGWRNDGRSWRHYRAAYLVMAGLAAPLVVSVHSVVSSDFAIGLTPGWHSTVYPPYFVGGAIFSGFAMVLTLVIPARRFLNLKNVITLRHLENCAKLLLVTAWVVIYGYLIEFFLAWYSGDVFESRQYFGARPSGPGSTLFWIMLFCNCLVPQLFWWKKARRTTWLLFIASILVNVGMWSERFVIVVLSLEREYLPSKWETYRPTWVDLGLLSGTLGFFGLLFLLFVRFIPFVSVTETKELREELEASGELGRGSRG